MGRKSNGFKVGDVIFNGYAGEENCYSIVIGRGSIRTSRFSTTSCYKQRTLFKGKLARNTSLMDIYSDKQTRIGHIDYEKAIVDEMQNLIKSAQPKPKEGDK